MIAWATQFTASESEEEKVAMKIETSTWSRMLKMRKLMRRLFVKQRRTDPTIIWTSINT
ncbi:unnamed protein product [Brugia timori]|uniref:Uncharacterized protein n=1 Tax=Brugia timori TaxID=42155 RepID=A0A0R3Q4J3_9BILA|nr:unnamed protein product [Brugia timori]